MAQYHRGMPRPPKEGVASQVDVARLARVSTQTVSRVMSGHPHVRPETARRVREAVDALGYRVHAGAASLASGRTRVLGVIILSTARYSSGALSVGIEEVAAAEGYTVTTATVAQRAPIAAFVAAFDRLEQQGAEGIVLASPIPADDPAMIARTRRIPTSIFELPAGSVDPDRVDQSLIARLATEHLLDLGHKTVWHVSGDEYWMEALERRDAWERVLRERGIEPPPVIPGDWTPESGYRAGRTLAAIPDATAVFVASDEMAFGVLRALHEAGRTVPDDISVASVDDIALAAYSSPALTTVKQPFESVGRIAATRVIDRIEGRAPTPMDPVVPELVVRASTAPPRA